MKNEDLLKGILSTRLFAGIPREDARRLTAGLRYTVQELPKGDPVDFGGPALGILLSGKMRVGGAACRRRAILNELTPGEVFGFATLYENGARFRSDLRAANAVRVLWIDGEELHKLFLKDVRVAENVMAIQAEKIRFLNARIRSFTTAGGEEKLLSYLRSLPADGDGTVVLPLGLQPLSKRLGVSRATLYRAFEKLERSGQIVKTEERAFRLCLRARRDGPDENERT